jgi:hypothetical protein
MGMNRRYYGLKALLVAIAVGLVVVSSIFGTPELGGTTIRVQYGAAVAVQSAALRTTARYSRAVRDFVREAECRIAHTV